MHYLQGGFGTRNHYHLAISTKTSGTYTRAPVSSISSNKIYVDLKNASIDAVQPNNDGQAAGVYYLSDPEIVTLNNSRNSAKG